MKPVAIDLFCGKGGWTNGLLEQGFEVYGFDIEPQPEYRGIFLRCDTPRPHGELPPWSAACIRLLLQPL